MPFQDPEAQRLTPWTPSNPSCGVQNICWLFRTSSGAFSHSQTRASGTPLKSANCSRKKQVGLILLILLNHHAVLASSAFVSYGCRNNDHEANGLNRAVMFWRIQERIHHLNFLRFCWLLACFTSGICSCIVCFWLCLPFRTTLAITLGLLKLCRMLYPSWGM